MNYENRVVLYLDILGFKKIIENTVSNNNEDKIEEINTVYENLMLIRKSLNIDSQEDTFSKTKQITQFSDSIVISFLVEENGQIFNTLLDILHLLITLTQQKILCRGGISYGKLIHNDKIIFGPALNKAYELESKISIYPRVIIDSEILEKSIEYPAEHHIKKREYELKSILDIISKDFDGFYYIDYILKSDSECGNEYVYLEYLQIIKDLAENNLNNKSYSIRQKMMWLTEKYNIFVENAKKSETIDFLKQRGEFELIDCYNQLNKIIYSIDFESKDTTRRKIKII